MNTDSKEIQAAASPSSARWRTVGIVLGIVLGLVALWFAFPIAALGIILAIVGLGEQPASQGQRLGLSFTLYLNGLTFGVPMLVLAFGILGAGPAIVAAMALSLLLPIMMGRYAWKLAEGNGPQKWKAVGIAVAATIGGITAAKLLQTTVLEESGTEDILLRIALLVIPAAGFAAILLLQRGRWRAQRETHLKNGFLIALTFLIVQYKSYDYITNPHRKALPWTTWDVHEWSWEEGFLPDFSYCLKAKMTRAEFMEYIAQFDLSLHPAKPKMDDDMPPPAWSGPNKSNDWWDVSSTMDSTYYIWPRYDSWTLAKYEHGYLYLHASEW